MARGGAKNGSDYSAQLQLSPDFPQQVPPPQYDHQAAHRTPYAMFGTPAKKSIRVDGRQPTPRRTPTPVVRAPARQPGSTVPNRTEMSPVGRNLNSIAPSAG